MWSSDKMCAAAGVPKDRGDLTAMTVTTATTQWSARHGWAGRPPSAGYYPGDAVTGKALADLRDHIREYVKGLPLRPGTTPLQYAPDYESWLIEAMSHGDYDE